MRTITAMALFVIIFSYISVSAQNTSFGLSAGIDFTKIHRTADLSQIQDLPFKIFYENLLSYNINGSFEYRYSEKFGALIEPGYIRKGEKVTGNSITSNWNFNYINLPVSIKYYLKDNLGLTLGPEISYLFKVTVKENQEKHDIDLNLIAFKKMDLSIRIGADLKVSKNFGLSIYLNHSIIPFNVIYVIYDKKYESKQFHKYLQLAFHYYLR